VAARRCRCQGERLAAVQALVAEWMAAEDFGALVPAPAVQLGQYPIVTPAVKGRRKNRIYR
jgi:hypothetical protein